MKDIKTVAVIGAGTLGSQIAMVSAAAGYRVTVYDLRPGALDKSLAELRQTLEAKGARPSVGFEHWERLMASMEQTRDLAAAVAQADLVIEVVPEDLALKRKVFEELGRLAPPQAILASNSSSLPVSRMEQSSGRPERCLNIHFSRPLEGLSHVDLMGGSRTLPEVMQAGEDYIRSLGCLPLRVKKEVLGFCFNRVWRAVKKEALHMWAQDIVDFRDIDRGWMSFTGMKEGPFGFMDQIGLDVVYDIEMVYYNESQDPGDRPPQALKDKIQRGELGVKTGRGFYTYPDPEYLSPEFMDPGKR